MAQQRSTSEVERKAILDAALRVMRKNGYAEAQIGDILSEAHLSTRAFYRHFDTKDDVLLALFRDNAEATAIRLAEKVAAAATPLEQLTAWIEETLSLGYDRRRATRVSVLASGAARRTAGYAEENAKVTAALTAPLLGVLEAGKVSGVFPTCDPRADATTIYAITWRLVAEAVGGAPSMDEQDARDHVLRFCLPAVGLSGPGPTRAT